MPDAQTFKVLDAIPRVPEYCTRIQIEQATGLGERAVMRRLKQLQLGGYVVLARGTGWGATDLEMPRPEAKVAREYAFRTVLASGVAWPY